MLPSSGCLKEGQDPCSRTTHALTARTGVCPQAMLEDAAPLAAGGGVAASVPAALADQQQQEQQQLRRQVQQP